CGADRDCVVSRRDHRRPRDAQRTGEDSGRDRRPGCSTVTRAIVAAVQEDKALRVTIPTADAARASVKAGDVSVAVIIPAGFGEASGLAFFGGGAKPDVSLLYDPSHRAEMGLVRGLMTQHVMEAVSREMFGGASGRKLADQALQNLDRS